MKKIYTLIAATALVFNVAAQDDFQVNLLSHTVGETDASDPMLFQYEVENVGTTTLPEGDTLWLGLTFDGAPLQVTLAGGFSGYIMAADLEPGDVFAVPDITIDWLDQTEPTTVEVCAIVYGNGAASFAGEGPDGVDYILNDDDISNNTACISAELPVVIDDSGIEDLNMNLSSIYVDASQLMIVNDGASDDVQANLNIVNMNGQIVQTENFILASGTSIVDLNSLPAGIYVVTVGTEEGVITRKISIQ